MKTGKLSLKRRIQEYNSNRLSSSSAKRAANIIGDIKSEEVHVDYIAQCSSLTHNASSLQLSDIMALVLVMI